MPEKLNRQLIIHKTIHSFGARKNPMIIFLLIFCGVKLTASNVTPCNVFEIDCLDDFKYEMKSESSKNLTKKQVELQLTKRV